MAKKAICTKRSRSVEFDLDFSIGQNIIGSMIKLEKELNERWNNTWQRLGGVGNPDIPFAELMSHYGEPGRYHHTAIHIKSCLDQLEMVKQLAKDPDAVELAAWTHDVIYDPKAADNEVKSAELARRIFTQAQFSPTLVTKIEHLVMGTKDHQSSDDIDEQIMSDIDLLILGSHPREYGQYKGNVRLEFIDVPLYQFRLGRAAFLHTQKDRLEKGQLFQVPYFRYKYEESTTNNLTQEIKELESMRVAVYAGSFDPPTNGHLYVINQASNLFDNLVVAIGQNPGKKEGRFPVADRLVMLKEITATRPNIDVTSYPVQYLIDFAKSVDAGYIVRGLRNEEDFTSESALDEFNFGVDPKVATVFLRTPDKLSRISSSFVMGLIGFEGWQEKVRERVPEQVFKRILASR